MKKTLLFILIAILCLFIYSCDSETQCEHKNMEKTEFRASCTENGYTHYKCPDCSVEFDSDLVSMNGHAFEEKVIEPTCETVGYTYATCKNCDFYTSYDFIRAHTHDFEGTVIKPSCENEGYTHLKCKKCDFESDGDYVSASGHDYSQAVVEATCDSEGYTVNTCKNCPHSYISDHVSPKGHIYTETLVRPSFDTEGYDLYECDFCDYEYRANYTHYSSLFTGAAGEGRGEVAWGIDVSFHNETIDWQALKDQGIKFAIIRLGSSYSKDAKFEEHYAGAKAVGIDVGVYFFTYSEDVEGAKKDAELTLKYLDGKQLEYPVFYDMEDYKDGGYMPSELPVDTRTDMFYAYVEAIIAANYYPGIYTNLNWIQNKFSEKQLCSLFDVWLARYPGAEYNKYLQEYSEKYSMWQYTNSATLDGIYGNIDLNIAFKDYPAIVKELGMNGY